MMVIAQLVQALSEHNRAQIEMVQIQREARAKEKQAEAVTNTALVDDWPV